MPCSLLRCNPVTPGGPPSHVAGTRHAYLFLLQLEEGAAFIGCTPEKLFTLKGDELSTEALAGTRPRGESLESDASLAHEVRSAFLCWIIGPLISTDAVLA